MAKQDNDTKGDEETFPAAKRDGREGVDPHTEPGEFADDMRTNRFTPPPEPKEHSR
jgi:hypothetical protein